MPVLTPVQKVVVNSLSQPAIVTTTSSFVDTVKNSMVPQNPKTYTVQPNTQVSISNTEDIAGVQVGNVMFNAFSSYPYDSKPDSKFLQQVYIMYGALFGESAYDLLNAPLTNQCRVGSWNAQIWGSSDVNDILYILGSCRNEQAPYILNLKKIQVETPPSPSSSPSSSIAPSVAPSKPKKNNTVAYVIITIVAILIFCFILYLVS